MQTHFNASAADGIHLENIVTKCERSNNEHFFFFLPHIVQLFIMYSIHVLSFRDLHNAVCMFPKSAAELLCVNPFPHTDTF